MRSYHFNNEVKATWFILKFMIYILSTRSANAITLLAFDNLHPVTVDIIILWPLSNAHPSENKLTLKLGTYNKSLRIVGMHSSLLKTNKSIFSIPLTSSRFLSPTVTFLLDYSASCARLLLNLIWMHYPQRSPAIQQKHFC